MPEAETHSYRCPVCGHTDGVDLKAGVALKIPCSHCDTLLELRLDTDSSERVSVVRSRPEE
ncbi:MAG: hypothetical protein PVJ04_10335 [Gemmatimonadota bacterium]|jgi:transcription elongation factor Elf1